MSHQLENIFNSPINNTFKVLFILGKHIDSLEKKSFCQKWKDLKIWSQIQLDLKSKPSTCYHICSYTHVSHFTPYTVSLPHGTDKAGKTMKEK